jgi:hypothetical protein
MWSSLHLRAPLRNVLRRNITVKKSLTLQRGHVLRHLLRRAAYHALHPVLHGRAWDSSVGSFAVLHAWQSCCWPSEGFSDSGSGHLRQIPKKRHRLKRSECEIAARGGRISINPTRPVFLSEDTKSSVFFVLSWLELACLMLLDKMPLVC